MTVTHFTLSSSNLILFESMRVFHLQGIRTSGFVRSRNLWNWSARFLCEEIELFLPFFMYFPSLCWVLLRCFKVGHEKQRQTVIILHLLSFSLIPYLSFRVCLCFVKFFVVFRGVVEGKPPLFEEGCTVLFHTHWRNYRPTVDSAVGMLRSLQYFLSFFGSVF